MNYVFHVSAACVLVCVCVCVFVCLLFSYCSPSCQQRDWTIHRKFCHRRRRLQEFIDRWFEKSYLHSLPLCTGSLTIMDDVIVFYSVCIIVQKCKVHALCMIGLESRPIHSQILGLGTFVMLSPVFDKQIIFLDLLIAFVIFSST